MKKHYVGWINKYKNNKLENLTQKKKSYKIKQKHVNYALKMLKRTPTFSIYICYGKK